MNKRKSLFIPAVDNAKLNPLFLGIRDRDNARSARWMLDEIYQDFEDPDGNFLEQFQTTGFNARFFELYLFAYFIRTGFIIERPKDGPDFIIQTDNCKLGVEATTTNPSTSGILAKYGKKITDLSSAETEEYLSNEMPIRFGSALKSKLDKEYWNLARMKGLPLVLAIETFHDDMSLGLSDSTLIRYVYGTGQSAQFTRRGKLEIESYNKTHHNLATKQIESGFFSMPNSENISAILFTNAGTYPKFVRMGYQHGIANDEVHIMRRGLAYHQDEDAMDAMYFAYTMDNPPHVEAWGEGCTVIHNPNCLHPLPQNLFKDATDVYRTEEGIVTFSYGWHPYNSYTTIVHFGELGSHVAKILSLKGQRFRIAPIKKDEFRKMCGHSEFPELFEERGWFADDSFSFLGVVTYDKIDQDWGLVILARDKYFMFRCIESQQEIKGRKEAVSLLRNKMAELLHTPRRIFSDEK